MGVKAESRSESGKVGGGGGGRSRKAHGHASSIPLLGKENTVKPTTSDELSSVLGSWADQRVNEHTSYVQSLVERNVGDLQGEVPPHVGCKVVVGGSHSFGGLEGTVVGTDRDRLVVRLNTVDDEGEPLMLTLAPNHCTKVGRPIIPPTASFIARGLHPPLDQNKRTALHLSSSRHPEQQQSHDRCCPPASLPVNRHSSEDGAWEEKSTV